ncbi:MAG: phosphoribosylglycinamide formyltransferase [Nitrospirales bacterium]|nr:MAG: phosphoribosylglycinamide formyltransferase [Nitrospirales bacterium]
MASVVLGVLISGRGSNLQSIIDAIEAGKLDARIAVVVSNKLEAFGLERARSHGIKTVFLDPKFYKGQPNSREAYDVAVLDVLKVHDVGLVILAGYMKIVTPVLIDAYEGRMMNIHPSLLPSFPGLAAQQQALDWGAKVSGCTVHFATEGVDEGPIILQAAVPVFEDDTVEDLSGRILESEHRIYPEAIQLYAEKRLVIQGRQVKVLPNRSSA